ncbi:sugar transferase [Microlunatus capsulatus]|uniref:Lipopolysaccharide/colanic/teichoic acid biosynthesis glycosyltransferase n=1 Tax=Microlunatus capsulatus TaxID=99117 RepID=A0ABS4Z6N7_9ACTN|nr:sugar transferase [Microlunatus capsulatus]MBP2415918.1 lipopolysaccharide/colanic/teichoic acid biosynthesis glycosyltransferase [Microlunatus capsulatus]
MSLVTAPSVVTAVAALPSVPGPSAVPAPSVAAGRRGLAAPAHRVLKRTVDLLGAAAALLVLGPVLLVVALAVKLGDPAGPVLYRQARVGRGGRAVGVWKFRSMTWAYSTGPDRPHQTAAAAFTAMGRADLVEEFEREQKVADDPRISRLGRALRASSLDELPQLVNVLVGQLSLVGPRPVVPAELERYGDAARHYLAVKPGITGLWQVSGRSNTGYEERVQLDVRYVTQWNPLLDLVIALRTVRTVLAREGAV